MEKFTIAFDAKRAFHNNSGLGNYSRDLIRMVSKRLPNSTFILFNTKPSTKFKYADNCKEILPKYKLLGSYWRRFQLYKESEKQNTTIFHGLSNELPSGVKTPFKKVVTIHDLIFERYPEWYKNPAIKVYRSKTKDACKQADCIVAISEQTKKDLINFYSIPKDKIKVIYQTCHPAFLKKYSTAELQVVSDKYNLPKRFLLNVGTIEKRKNVGLIIESLKNLPDIPLLIIGKKTSYYSEISERIKNLGLQNRVYFPKVDSMEDLAKIYQLAKIFIYPSIFEGFGIPIIEALFSETPVITNKNGVFPEAGGPNSYYIDCTKTEELEEKMKYILDNPEEVKKACKESSTFASKFLPETLAEQWVNLYTNVVEK